MVLWIVLGAALAVLLVLAVLAYNHLVRLRNEAETGWANIDVQLRRRMRLMSLVAVLVGVVALFSDFLFRISFFGGGRKGGGAAGLIAFAIGLVALALAPIAALLIQLAVSRRREYLADASAAEITGDGEGLALALRKLQLDISETRHASRAVAHLYIENPLNQASGFAASMRGMFETHPPLEARIAALEEAGGFKLPPA